MISNRWKWFWILTLSFLSVGIMIWKVVALKFNPSQVVPVKAYKVNLNMSAEGFGAPIKIHSFLPKNTGRQKLIKEHGEAGVFSQTIQEEQNNRVTLWQSEEANGPVQINYSFTVRTHKEIFEVPPFILHSIKSEQDQEQEKSILAEYLQKEKLIEWDHPELVNLSSSLGLDTLQNLVEIVKRVYAFASDSISPAKFAGETSALTTLRLREASCNGKSRLAVALLRQQGIPSRLVGGIILKKTSKKTTHQWLEVRMGNQWVSMDPLNHHLFETPENYLILYYGDFNLFRRTSNVKFQYLFDIEPQMIAQTATTQAAWLNLWSFLQNARVSTNVLQIMLMIPFGALMTVLFRNMIGLNTYGTFLPALIATSFKDTGLFWGLLGFTVLIMLGALLRVGLGRLHLLHTPKLTIILIMVILSMLGLTVLGIHYHIKELSETALFPIAVLSITIERFSMIAEENSYKESFSILFNTLIVVTFTYLCMMSVFLQTLVLAFPEVLLLIVAVSIYLGRWTGIRVTELWRFRHYLRG